MFLQFIDCVYQLLSIHLFSFEFTPSFLRAILDQLYGCSFGTFLFNNENERKQKEVFTKTPSLWNYLNDPEIQKSGGFLNPHFSENENPLFEDPSFSSDCPDKYSLRIWSCYTRTKGASLSNSLEDVKNQKVLQLKEDNSVLASLRDQIGQLLKLKNDSHVTVRLDGTKRVVFEVDGESDAIPIIEDYDPNATDISSSSHENFLSNSFVELVERENPSSCNSQGWSDFLSSLYSSVVQYVSITGDEDESNSNN